VVDTIPALGTGKIDLRMVKAIAIEKARLHATAETPPISISD
jgi:hypothetical protein